MKGIQLVTMAVILLVLAVVVFIVIAVVLGRGVTPVFDTEDRTNLRSCCSDRGIYNCDSSTVGSVSCKIGDTSVPMTELMTKANITPAQINDFCFCFGA